jgi:hypothetical protein
LKASDSYENKQKATFLESFVWDYENALKDREEYCKDAPENDSYCLKFKLTLNSYYPKDSEWNYLQWTRMYVDWRDIWAWAWNKEIEVENQFIHRIAIEKEWYLDYFWKYPISSVGNLQESFNPKLVKANSWTIIKSSEETTLYTNNFDFIIKPNTFVDANWKVYNWDIKIYLFDLWSENNNENVFNLDVFTSDNLSFVWTSMVTFWMPYLTIYDTKWNRLYIWSEIIWRWQIQNTEKAPNIDLKNVPKNVYLWKAELEEYWIPPFWNLDLKNWVWKESKMKILDNGWNYEFIYN